MAPGSRHQVSGRPRPRPELVVGRLGPGMTDGERELRLHAIGIGEGARDRAMLIIDRLALGRSVTGDCPDWRVTYRGVDSAGALELLEADLTGIDPRWTEALDFAAVPSQPLPEAEFS